MMQLHESRRQAGVTLIELLIVVVIVGILAAVGYPAYRDQVRRSNRAEARSALMELASRQEQFILDNKSYASTMAALGMTATTENSLYTLSITSASATSYTAQAAPQGKQAEDTACGNLTINDGGTKSASGSLGADCW